MEAKQDNAELIEETHARLGEALGAIQVQTLMNSRFDPIVLEASESVANAANVGAARARGS